jgi:uncharacterized pyridoxal phosphate-containing UPF0001 family protein
LEITEKLVEFADSKFCEIFYGVGENRIESLERKNLEPALVHFIGRIQSRQIKNIVKYTRHIHSLDSIKHASKINLIAGELGIKMNVFVQVFQDENKNYGVKKESIREFLRRLSEFKNLKVVGISGMGSAEFSEIVKKQEFLELVEIRNKYLKNGLISAGTSRDFEIALVCGIDIVRIGQKILDE